MATSHEIPSEVNATTTVNSTNPISTPGTFAVQPYIYITAIISSGTVTVITDDGTVALGGGGAVGPVAFPSPLKCLSFTAAANGQIAYYIQ